ncbi:MAG: epoxide hydrolase family protein [Acidobacteriota bacterium]
MTGLRPFTIDVPEIDLEDLRSRLERSRLPERETVDDWSQGVPLAYMREIRDSWLNDYDWRELEAKLNAQPQLLTEIDGVEVHFFHHVSPHAEARPLVMTHGWPGSILEFQKVIAPLVDPPAFGGEPADAFHLVVPSLPGYGFSGKPTRHGWSVEKIADAWNELMGRLGYERYYAQGGDWGSAVTTAIGVRHPKRCLGIHLNMPTVRADPKATDLTDQEKDALLALKYYRDWDSGYSKQQSTRPQTLGYALVDSPLGQAAWILEKFWSWMDCDGHPENVLTRTELLDNVSWYWLTASGASSARLYWESFAKGGNEPVEVPVGCSLFPKEIFRASRRWAEARYRRLVYWNRLEKGGHFAAFERPEDFVREVRAAIAAMA